MYFGTKSYLKSNRNHIAKHILIASVQIHRQRQLCTQKVKETLKLKWRAQG